MSVVFDEVTVKERLIVEGGDNSQVLSQFDGPATFNNEVRIKSTLDVSGKTKFSNTSEATSSTDAAVVFSGGVGINTHSQLPDDAQLRFGNSSDLAIYHDSENSFIKDSGTGSLILNSNQLEIKNAANSAVGLKYQEGSSIELYHGGTKQFETSSKGVQVGSGVTIETNGQATFIGVVTATSFSGNVLGNITGNIVGNVTGNADTAGKADGLTTSRTIGGVSFDGSANIDLPGVNVSGNQDTTGTATNASNVQVGTLGDSVGPHFIFMKTGSSSEFAEPKVDAGISYNSSTNTLSVAGDVIAFASDDRLKTDKLLIDNPLDKVMQIEGFTFNFNEIGSKIFDTSVRHVGVSAQQIQKVLPEAVASAPMNLIDDEDYLTVKYDKLVPLLIEAIKELNKKVEKLEQKLSDK